MNAKEEFRRAALTVRTMITAATDPNVKAEIDRVATAWEIYANTRNTESISVNDRAQEQFVSPMLQGYPKDHPSRQFQSFNSRQVSETNNSITVNPTKYRQPNQSVAVPTTTARSRTRASIVSHGGSQRSVARPAAQQASVPMNISTALQQRPQPQLQNPNRWQTPVVARVVSTGPAATTDP